MPDTPLNPEALARLIMWKELPFGGNPDSYIRLDANAAHKVIELLMPHLAAAQPQVEGGDVEREAAVIAALAEELDEIKHGHDIAECAGYVEGETGRQACIDKWEAITEEPAEWLRKKAAEHSTQGFEYLRYIAYEAWYAGKESAPGEENPYADKKARSK